MEILVMEDDPRLLNVIVRKLRDEGYCVQSRIKRLEGVRVAQDGHFVGIILDIMIPGIDGCEVLCRLQQDHKRRRIRGHGEEVHDGYLDA
jgi:DNA-binding response OmpR family regulator